MIRKSLVPTLVTATLLSCGSLFASAADIDFWLRYQRETSLNSGRFHRLTRSESWKAQETAIIVCDVWDTHHSRNAVRRIEEFVPRLNEVLNDARDRGITIIHAPSDCMPFYEHHPARVRAIAAPPAEFIPHDCAAWCSIVPAEERAVYPIDQSDGGDDDDPEEHAVWAKQLADMDRKPGTPWIRQSELISIDGARDFISDDGTEVWNVLAQRNIRNVILAGVHTNMCVLGRPFGLRQMARNGKNVVLMRDMTDTMYNPRRWPYVSHFTGTDLIISHIERYVCPTITSDQFLGGNPFRFKNDSRPHLVMLIAEDEYRTEETLPPFAVSHLGRDFRVTTVFGSDRERNRLPGLECLDEADVLLVSVRRRVLPPADMKRIRDFVCSGKPVIGIRTASHAFSLRKKSPPEGYEDWPEFDAEVFGGNYHGHHGNELKSEVWVSDPNHPLAIGQSAEHFVQGGSLYMTSPLAQGTTVITTGSVDGHPPEPVTWTFQRPGEGRSFYSSMGHVDDFDNPSFTNLLYQGICWAAGISASKPDETVESSWSLVDVPAASDESNVHEPFWLRCAFRLPVEWSAEGARLVLPETSVPCDAWVNGQSLTGISGGDSDVVFDIPTDLMQPNDANLLVLKSSPATSIAPRLRLTRAGKSTELVLAGRWQRRADDGNDYSAIPLPAKFGTSPDIVFEMEDPLWVARPVTQPGEFTPGIEGPACDDVGNVFAVNYEAQGTIGRVTPGGSGEVFVTLPDGSVGNGIRFDEHGDFYVADYTQHNILKVDTRSKEVSVFAHNADMNQPNDLAIAPDGTLYASDPNWKNSTGQLWRIDRDGSTTRLAADMGTTNGIDVSPDGRTLYVNESVQRNIWAFDISDSRELSNKRLLRKFDDHGFDGMRCDVDGNLYVTRHGAGTVIKMTPAGKILQTINVLGSRPSNLCFGDPDGRTVYVTEVDGQRLVRFRVDRPGRSWAEQHNRR